MTNKLAKENLTSEKLKEKFPNQFDLVTSAINCARDLIRTGKDFTEDGESVNVAFLAVEMLSEKE